jgi:hypothetical protein
MAVAILDDAPATHHSLSRWRYGAGEVILWSAILLLIVYPLLMIGAAVIAPAFPGQSTTRVCRSLERSFRHCCAQHLASRHFG